jgi:hypothetical protein
VIPRNLPRLALLVLISSTTSAPPLLARPVCRVRDHGAQGDGMVLDTAAIQAAVDDCAARGGGTVVVGGPATYLTGTILLKDHVTLRLEDGAVLKGAPESDAYRLIDPFNEGTGQTFGAGLVGAEGARDVAVEGTGTLDGQGALWVKASGRGPRPFLLRFVRCRNVHLSGIRLTQSAAWGCNLYQCRRVRIDGLRIDSHANSNNDGIDLDSCRDVVIRRCSIDTGDDAIVFKTTSDVPLEDVTVRDCDLKSRWGAIKWGTESLADMRRFRISRCRIHDTEGGGLKMLTADGAVIEDVHVRDVVLERVDMPIALIVRARGRTYRDLPARATGTIRGVRFEGITAHVPDEGRVRPATGVLVSGLPGHPISDVRLGNVLVSVPGGGAAADLEREIPRLESHYPEYRDLGVLPAYGAFARHARDLDLTGVRWTLRQPDARPAVRCEDVVGAGCPPAPIGKMSGASGEPPAAPGP